MSVGRRIALKRTQKGLTQTELANVLGVKPASISQYETGDRNPPYEKLIKIANILETSLEFLLIGDEDRNGYPDSITKQINLALPSFTEEKKKELFTVMKRMAGVTYHLPFSLPERLLSSPEDYAEYTLSKLDFNSFPIDPFLIAKRLGIRILFANEIESYGELIKCGENPTIILETDQHPSRQRFTVSMFIGHLVMPWHLRMSFYREKNTNSSNVSDPFSIEARRFATELLTPRNLLQPEFNRLVEKKDPLIPLLEELSLKLQVSLFTLLISLAEYLPSNYVVLNTTNFDVTNKFIFNNLFLVNEISKETKAYELLLNLPNEKTLVNGWVPHSAWFINGNTGKDVFEEVIYNPKEVSGPPQFLVLLKLN